MRAFQYVKPTDMAEAVTLLTRNPDATVLAGGTNLVDLMKLGVVRPGMLVDVTGLGMDAIEHRTDGSTFVGATVRNSDLAGDKGIRQRFPVLSEAILAGASGQLRGGATTGGNLLQRTRCVYFQDITKPCNKRKPGSGCSAAEGLHRDLAVIGTSSSCYASHPSDMAVALAALDAKIVVRRAGGEEVRSAIDDFYRLPGDTPERENVLEPGELITGVEIPAAPAGAVMRYRKVRDRASYAFAVVSVAAIIATDADGAVDNVRVALGGIGSRPWRAHHLERALLGRHLDPALLQQAGHEEFANATPLPQNAFKVGLGIDVISMLLRDLAGVL
jgi:xanthine dehydrogenase YagS FAD-binding subunit